VDVGAQVGSQVGLHDGVVDTIEKPTGRGATEDVFPVARAVKPSADMSATTDPHIAIVELLFFAYRDFTAAADEILTGYGLGRAHHRVLHFVHRNPGLRVADLLELLRITKQSLARVLKQLIDEDWIVQQATADDRRVRRLYTTAQGRRLAERLITLQTERVARSLPGGDATIVQQFLASMMAPEHRDRVAAVVKGDAAASFVASSQPHDGGGQNLDANVGESAPPTTSVTATVTG
jgi:DNA-binding MarR family transcriptional regulator